MKLEEIKWTLGAILIALVIIIAYVLFALFFIYLNNNFPIVIDSILIACFYALYILLVL